MKKIWAAGTAERKPHKKPKCHWCPEKDAAGMLGTKHACTECLGEGEENLRQRTCPLVGPPAPNPKSGDGPGKGSGPVRPRQMNGC